MRPALIIGVLLIALGLLAFSYQGVLWVQGREQIAKIGPVEVQREKQIPVPLAPILGGLAILGGIAVLLSGNGNGAR